MVWKALKAKSEVQVKPEADKAPVNVKRHCHCGERCKKCGDSCKCRVKRLYIRPAMFNYFTDLMH